MEANHKSSLPLNLGQTHKISKSMMRSRTYASSKITLQNQLQSPSVYNSKELKIRVRKLAIGNNGPYKFAEQVSASQRCQQKIPSKIKKSSQVNYSAFYASNSM